MRDRRGKSTLARDVGSDRTYLSLDDYGVPDQAQNAPDALLMRPGPLTIDEVQRALNLLMGIKRAVDEDRSPGRFLLTGSANLHLMQGVSETLAGRAIYLTLGPMTVSERTGRGGTARWSDLMDRPRDAWLSTFAQPELAPEWRWTDAARQGGFPDPSVHLRGDGNRTAWFESYVRTYLERDLQQLSSIDNLAGFQRLVRGAAHRVGNLLNQAELARDVGIPSSTVQRYMGLLETSYLLHPLHPYSVNRGKRLVKSPKAYWADTGLALHLCGNPTPGGAHLENLIVADLLVWRETRSPRPTVLFWRTSKGAEVDIVVETPTSLLPVEIKSGRTVRVSDARNLHVFLDQYPEKASDGVILYDGDATFWLTDRVIAIPLGSFMA